MKVTLIAAITADGFIGRSRDDRSFDWTSIEDKKFYVDQIKKADAIVMGRQTFETFDRYPKGSHWVIYTSRPNDFQNPKPDVISAEGTDLEPQKLLQKLSAEGKENIMICGGSSVYGMFMEAELVDQIYLTVESVMFGEGIKLLGKNKTQIDLNLEQVHQLSEQTVVLEYQVKK